ncbi:hypothetical protein GCM10022206_02340 [Streptomyces chiangmaiensis]
MNPSSGGGVNPSSGGGVNPSSGGGVNPYEEGVRTPPRSNEEPSQDSWEEERAGVGPQPQDARASDEEPIKVYCRKCQGLLPPDRYCPSCKMIDPPGIYTVGWRRP